MSCMKNDMQFLFFKWKGSHTPEDVKVEIYGMSSWNQYKVTRKCSLCECGLDEVVRTESGMLELGYNLQKLQEVDSGHFSFGTCASKLR